MIQRYKTKPSVNKAILFIFILAFLVYISFYFFTLSRAEIPVNYKGSLLFGFFLFISLPLVLYGGYLFIMRLLNGREDERKIPLMTVVLRLVPDHGRAKMVTILFDALIIVVMLILIVAITGYRPVMELKDLSAEIQYIDGVIEDKYIRGESNKSKNAMYYVVVGNEEFEVSQSTFFKVEKGYYLKIQYLPNSQLLIGETEIVKNTPSTEGDDTLDQMLEEIIRERKEGEDFTIKTDELLEE